MFDWLEPLTRLFSAARTADIHLAHIGKLKTELEIALRQVAALTQQVAALTAENKELKTKVAELEKQVANHKPPHPGPFVAFAKPPRRIII
jgi:cell division protein FtsB